MCLEFFLGMWHNGISQTWGISKSPPTHSFSLILPSPGITFTRKAIHFSGRKQGLDKCYNYRAFHILSKQSIQASACRLTESNCYTQEKHKLPIQKQWRRSKTVFQDSFFSIWENHVEHACPSWCCIAPCSTPRQHPFQRAMLINYILSLLSFPGNVPRKSKHFREQSHTTFALSPFVTNQTSSWPSWVTLGDRVSSRIPASHAGIRDYQMAFEGSTEWIYQLKVEL